MYSSINLGVTSTRLELPLLLRYYHRRLVAGTTLRYRLGGK
jgi:hypothetical protein